MIERTLVGGSPAELGSLLRLPSSVTGRPNMGTGSASAKDEDVSVAGVMLLSAVSVFMAILGMLTLALFVIGCWWLISHIPVPQFAHQLLARLHLARA
jgi:hypothetical protein